MDFADGELLRTSETVVCDSSKCSASVLKLTCPDGVASLPLAMLEFVARLLRTRNSDSKGNISIFLMSNRQRQGLLATYLIATSIRFSPGFSGQLRPLNWNTPETVPGRVIPAWKVEPLP